MTSRRRRNSATIAATPSCGPSRAAIAAYWLNADVQETELIASRVTGSTSAAVVGGIGRTGRLVTSAAIILFLTFVSMITAPSTMVKMIATGLGAGIILDATVIRALLVTATVALFGQWNWKFPDRAARLLLIRQPTAAEAPQPEPEPVAS